MEQRKRDDSQESYKSNNSSKYSDYYNNVLVKEQPFYRSGMSQAEAKEELDYLNENLNSFFEGLYKPLWKQNIYR